MRALITGGAGFIGSHIADELLDHGWEVRAIDWLDPQVHEEPGRRPEYLNRDVELLIGDVGDASLVSDALSGVDVVFHMAAAVGVGQSMYEIRRYTQINNLATATLLEALIKHPVQRLVVASSMSIYGEGAYRDAQGRMRLAVPRTRNQMQRGEWECLDADGSPLAPIPTPETKVAEPSSVYALSKYDQERLCLIVGGAYNIPTVALRLFNAYGPRQALSNPYTGVLAIFASCLLNGNRPKIFEDGYQRRDFVSVHDVARACRLALDAPEAPGEVINVGSGQSYTVREVAEELSRAVGGRHIEPIITNRYRTGDVRHCFADIEKARRLLGYEPRVTLPEGLQELAAWLDGKIATDRTASAHRELADRGLTV
ncbi:MAG: NAD-dependent epimerase/dehydratase family protein [Planctomycetes bacterium]|nr:NAD-dependent epimerase/dehydratase family protein [Planctomycetota bacterium]